MEDNASIHKLKLTRATHAEHDMWIMEWLANSPDLNPIENIWRVLKMRLAKRWPKTADEVEQFLIEEWEKLTMDEIRKYCSGEVMRARCEAVITAEGGSIDW
jgi:transposase